MHNINKYRKYYILYSIVVFPFIISCASIPKESVELSKTIGGDIVEFHRAHRATIKLLYQKMKDDINDFVDTKYTPYIINYVLKDEWSRYRKGQDSLYTVIENAGKSEGDKQAKEALDVMQEFIEAANIQISKYRKELISPVLEKEEETLKKIDESYQNFINANKTLTAYLDSLYQLHKSKQKMLSWLGLSEFDNFITPDIIAKANQTISEAIKGVNVVDVEYDNLQDTFNDVKSKIEEIVR